jgi:hypothetical protein
MSDIWGLSDGGSAADTGAEYEIPGGGNFDVIPDGSKVLAMVEDAEWKDDGQGHEFLNLKWSVVKPEAVQNRKVFQKLWIKETDPRERDADKAAKKRDRARRLFAAIDANAGGKLAKKGGIPGSEDVLLALANKLMVIRLGVWSMDDNRNPGQKMEGNWVQAVAPKTAEVGLTEAKAPAPQRSQTSGRDRFDDIDSIPF